MVGWEGTKKKMGRMKFSNQTYHFFNSKLGKRKLNYIKKESTKLSTFSHHTTFNNKGIVGTRGPMKDSMTVAFNRSSHRNIYSPRSEVARGEDGKRRNVFWKYKRWEEHLRGEIRYFWEVSCKVSPTPPH